jgi:23S rRNA (cytosine1962-C5)-methyltransferase
VASFGRDPCLLYHARVTISRGKHDEARPALQPSVFPGAPFDDYRLLDSGAAQKLERFGPVVLRRPDPQALWSPRLSRAEWDRADLTFVRESDRGGHWDARRAAHAAAIAAEPEWIVSFGAGRFLVRPTPFKHVGIFPEQASNWTAVARAARSFGVARPRLLNLFGYTGVGSVLAARAGYEVTHVDASKASLSWTRDNLRVSGLAPDSVRIVLDDALAYARREVRRQARYHVVLLDPPHYGRGPKGERWQFEEDIAPLVQELKSLLEARALVVLSTYAIGCSPLALDNLIRELGGGEVSAGELALRETGEPSADPDDSNEPSDEGPRPARWLPAGFCARWSRGIDIELADEIEA